MRKAQSQILGAVLITAIVLLVSGSAFIWGKPLIDKSTDKSKIDSILLKLDEIDSAIKQAASTGSSKSIKATLNEQDELSVTRDGEIKFTTYALIPVISTKDFAPLNSYELSFKKELFGVETNVSLNPTTYAGLNIGASGFNIKNNSVMLENAYYNVLLYVTSAEGGSYDYACFDDDFNVKTDECAREFQSVKIGGIDYTIQRIDDEGGFVYFTGKDVENVGVITRDVPGVISGKSRVIGTNEGLLTTLILGYRGLMDNKGVVHRIILECKSSCLSTRKDTAVKIVRTDVIRTGDSIDTYINVELG